MISSPAMADAPLNLSVVVPVKNEAGNILPLIEEIEAACSPLHPYEIIYVDDGSDDATPQELMAARQTFPHLRIIRHSASLGQSSAVITGIRAARSPYVATLDGDGQNNPVFLPRLRAALLEAGEGTVLAMGQRVGRKDGRFKSFQSRIANAARRFVLKDGTRDTGCGLKCFYRDRVLALPAFDALHRFMPALINAEGYKVVYLDVQDRPRMAGVSKYGMFNRLWVGIGDLIGVSWLIRRRRNVSRIAQMQGEVLPSPQAQTLPRQKAL